MSIKSICKTNPVTVNKNATLKEAAKLMHDRHVGCVIVTEGFNGGRVPSGVLTDRDIALTVGASTNPQNIKVENIMQSQPITAKTSDGIYETVVKMRKSGLRRLPVVNDEGSLYGIISVTDLLSLMGDEINNLARITEKQIKIEQGILKPTEKEALA